MTKKVAVPPREPSQHVSAQFNACGWSFGPAVWEQKNYGTSGSEHKREYDCAEHSRNARIDRQRRALLPSLVVLLRSSLISYFFYSSCEPPIYWGRSLICFLLLLDGSNYRYPASMEYFFACPYCSEEISMVLDTSVARQTYIEDCEVCCRPIEVRYTVEDDEVSDFEATAV